MKKFLKSLGLFILFILVVSIFLYYAVIDKTIPQWADVGWLEIAFFILGASINADILISLIIVTSLMFLRFKNVLKIDFNVIVFIAYLINLIVVIYIRTSLRKNLGMEFNLFSVEELIFCLIVPFIHTAINYSILKIIIKKKFETLNN